MPRMKRYLLVVAWLLVSLNMVAQESHAQPFYTTQGYLLSLLGYSDADDVDENIRKQLSAYEFRTPDSRINAQGGLLSVAVIKQGKVPQEYNDLLQRFFGIQPLEGEGRCVLQPDFPGDWDSCSVHTPLLDYTFRRQGSYLVFDIIQHFQHPLTIVLRQHSGMGEYVEIVGTKGMRQTLRMKAPSLLPDVAFHSAYDDAALLAPGLEEPTFEERFRPQRIEALLTDSIPFDIDPDFLIENKYVVRGVPFSVAQQGNNIAWVSYPDTLSIPLNTKAHLVWFLLSDTPVSRDPHQSKAFFVAHYQDGTADILPLINPDNWTPVAAGKGRRLSLPLNPDKKLAAIRIRPLASDVKIGLMGVTLQ